MSKEIKVEEMFYFVWDGMIVLKSYTWSDVLEKAKEYYSKYGANHDYYLYTVNKHDFKDFIKIKE